MKDQIGENPHLTEMELADLTASQFNIFIDEVSFDIPPELVYLATEVINERDD